MCFSTFFFPVSCLVSIPGTLQPRLISAQPKWINDGPRDSCPKYLPLQGMENQKHANQKQSCHRSNGEQEWSQRKQMLMMQDTPSTSFVKATCRAGSQHYKNLWEWPTPDESDHNAASEDSFALTSFKASAWSFFQAKAVTLDCSQG